LEELVEAVAQAYGRRQVVGAEIAGVTQIVAVDELLQRHEVGQVLAAGRGRPGVDQVDHGAESVFGVMTEKHWDPRSRRTLPLPSPYSSRDDHRIRGGQRT